MDPDGSGEELQGVEGGETITRTDYVRKKLLSIKGKSEKKINRVMSGWKCKARYTVIELFARDEVTAFMTNSSQGWVAFKKE